MRLDLLKSVARSLLRTANRRLSQYKKAGILNPDIENLLDKIEYQPYFNAEKGKLQMRDLNQSQLKDLVEVERYLRGTETVRGYKKSVKKVYESVGLDPKTDPNLFYRAVKRFEETHGTYYREWTDNIEKSGDVDAKGDTLKDWFVEIINEQINKEYTPQEVESITKDGGFKDF